MANLKDLVVQGPSRLIGDTQGTKFIVNGGTSSQALMGDGSLATISSATQVNTALAGKASTATSISTASGLTGGGNLSANRTIGLAATGTAGTYKQVVVDAYGRVTSGNTADNNTWRSIKVNGANFLTDTSTALNLSGGSNVTLTTGSTGLLTIKATNTTYSAGTAAQLSTGTDTYNGLWSAKNLKDGMNAVYAPKSHNQASSTITAMTSYSKPSSTSAIATGDTLNAAIGKLEKALDDKANTSHNQASNTITAMTNYSMAESGTPITSADTLNQAIGKLEKMNHEITDYFEEKELATAAALTDLNDRKANISSTVTSTTDNDYVKMVTEGGNEVKVTKDSFVQAMASILNNYDKGTSVNKTIVSGTDGKLGVASLGNLASLLSGDMYRYGLLNGNADDITYNSIYSVAPSQGYTTGVPQDGIMLTFATNIVSSTTSVIAQMVFASSGIIFRRKWYTQNWSEWIEL